MALAQPTDLLVQNLNTLITVDQSVERHNLTDVLITESGDILATEDGQDLASERLTIIQLMQLVDDSAVLRPGGTLITFSQEVETNTSRPGKTLITFSQDVERHVTGDVLVTLRQTVLSDAPGQALEALKHTLIYLDDQDITARCSIVYDVTGSESDNRTATVTLYPPSGAINITSFQGREIEIHRKIQGTWQAIFTGKVDIPKYDRYSRTLQLRCTDLRNERLGKEDQSALKTLTGGLYSEVTQREEAEGEQWVRELMKTVEGSLDYTGAGSLRYRPWAVAAPRYSLEPGDIHHREIDLEFSTRSEIVNRVKIDVAFRWYKRHTFSAAVSAGIKRSTLCKGGTCLPAPGQALPTREAALQAAYNINNWQVLTVSAGTPPPSGWYRDSSSAFNDPFGYVSSPAFQEAYATSVSATLVRYVSQGMRSTTNITIEAPQSIDQFGPVDGSEISFSIDTNIDPSVFEEAGCFTRPEKDRLADRSDAIEAAQAMAAKQIRGSHRQNYASFRYKPETGRPGEGQLLAVEIGDTISVTSDEVTVVGWVTEFTHSNTREGDTYTDIKLAVSRVDSAVVVTDDLAVPAVGTPNKLNKQAIQAEPRTCGPTAEPEEDQPQVSQIAMDGSITLVAPSIPADKTDELVGECFVTYSIAIPVNTFEVEVP